MAGQWGQYLQGFGNLPFSTNYGSEAARDYMAAWEPAWGAFLAPYLQRFAGTSFGDFFSRREGELQQMFEAENARRIAEGGDIFSQMRPDEWLAAFNPLQYYLSQPPERRGEGGSPAMFGRWTRF